MPAPGEVLAATNLVRSGRVFSLARDRFPRMPLFPGHPNFEVLAYRTPQGIRAAGDQPWGPGNEAGLGYMSELVMGTTHSGAHIDAHAHMTIGEGDRWNGGAAAEHLGDFGPLRGDATEIPPLWRRGVLYDVPAHRGRALPRPRRGRLAHELKAIEASTGVGAGAGDVALVRTGYMRHWPDEERMAEHRGPGPDISAARLLAERGVVATGLGHRDLRGAAGARPRGAVEPAAGAHAAPDRKGYLHHGEPGPGGAGGRGRARVPVRGPAAARSGGPPAR